MTKFLPLCSPEIENSLNILVQICFHSLIKSCYESNRMRFLQFIILAKPSFQMLFFEIFGKINASEPFTKFFVHHLKFLPKKGKEFIKCRVKDELRSFLESAIECTGKMVMGIFREPLENVDWNERKKIIRLHLDLLAGTEKIFDFKYEFKGTCISFELLKYRYLLENFSVVENRKINLQAYKNVYDKLSILSQDTKKHVKILRYASNSSKMPRPEYMNIHLFYIYTEQYFDYIASANFNFMNIEFLCKAIFLLGETKHSYYLSRFKDKEPLSAAIEILKMEIENKIMKIAWNMYRNIPRNCPLVQGFILDRKVQFSSPLANDFFNKYATGFHDHEKSLLGLRKPIVKIYLSLLRYEASIKGQNN
jgi:hypothetical protein